MKRIIDGKTYNTETATVIQHYVRVLDSSWLDEHVDPESENASEFCHIETLYQTRQGDLFLVVTDPQPNFVHGRPMGVRHVESLGPVTTDYALDWLKSHPRLDAKYQGHIHRLEVSKKRTANSTVLLRIPASLKERLETCAKNKGQSLNTWVMRSLEQAALDEEEKGSSDVLPPLPPLYKYQNEKE